MHANVKIDHVEAQQHACGCRGGGVCCRVRVAGMQPHRLHGVRDVRQRMRVHVQLHRLDRHAAHGALRIRVCVCVWLAVRGDERKERRRCSRRMEGHPRDTTGGLRV